MFDVSEYMKAVKQRFSVWYNRSHQRFGTLWAERFKSVLVEGMGNALQTMAAYIDLNSVRAGITEDPKDYRFCGYAEAVAGKRRAKEGLSAIWSDFCRSVPNSTRACEKDAMRAHRELIFGKRASDADVSEMSRKRALKTLESGEAILPKAVILRCRVRYFTEGAILGSQEFVGGFIDQWQDIKGRKFPPRVNRLKGSDWQNLATIQAPKTKLFS